MHHRGSQREGITLTGKLDRDVTTTAFTWLILLCLASCCCCQAVPNGNQGSNKVQKKQLDPETIQVLSSILESLDTFTNHRLKDLEKLRLAEGNATTGYRKSKDLRPFNGAARMSNITDSIRALKEGIMAHRPMKKTFGYKVTVYTSPIEKDGKDGKPLMVTQYVGGDLVDEKQKQEKQPVVSSRNGDLQESANNPRGDVVRTSGSAPYPVVHVADGAEAEHVDDAVESADSAGMDHARKTEHHASSEKGHHKALSEKSKIEKGHDRQSLKQTQGEHHKETDKESHRQDIHTHDKGGATQQGIRERTEIEYYEREHFLDTELDKDKGGHSKTSGVKEHEHHSDHDSHERKREHSVAGEKSQEHGSSASKADAEHHHHHSARPTHYTPPYGAHYPSANGAKGVHESTLAEKQKEGVLHSERNAAESKARKEHSSERDHHSQQEDSGYHDKDKARRKEGYRERGYKITAEREYFLNDAHHDTGTSAHKSGEKSRDREGVRHGSKEGERDKGYVKEHKTHDSHDAAYDAKERKYEDGETHSEGYAKSSAASSTASKENKHHEDGPDKVYLQEGPPVIRRPPIPVPHQVAYESSDGKSSPVIAYPPPQRAPSGVQRKNSYPPTGARKAEPLPSDIPDEDDVRHEGYVGYATYRRKPQKNPVLKTIRDSIRDEVNAPVPSYSKKATKNESPVPSDDKTKPNNEPEVRLYGTHLNPNQQNEKLRQNPPVVEVISGRIQPKDKTHQRHYTYNTDYRPERQRMPPASTHHYQNNPQPVRPIYQGPSQYRQQDYIANRQAINQGKDVYPQQDYDPVYPGVHDQQNVPLLRTLGILLPKLPDQPDPSLYLPQDNAPPPPPAPSSQTANKFSPVVILTNGPTTNNQPLDVWYTRQQK